LMSFLSDEEKYRDVTRLVLSCTECKTPFELTGPLVRDTVSVKPGMQCPSCSHTLSPQALYCQTLTLLRSTLSAYHQSWLQCDEPSCQAQTQRMRVYEARCVNDACRGSMRPKIPGSRPYYQLLYLRDLFDWEKAKQVLPAEDPHGEALHRLKRLAVEYEPVRAMILHQLNQCSFPIISLRDIFSFMVIAAPKPVPAV